MTDTFTHDSDRSHHESRQYRRLELADITLPAGEPAPEYRVKLTSVAGQTHWLSIDHSTYAAVSRALTTPTAHMWAISAHVETTTDDGYTSSRQVPTFYLHPNVQGTLTEESAERVARRMLAALAPNGAIVHVTAERVSA